MIKPVKALNNKLGDIVVKIVETRKNGDIYHHFLYSIFPDAI